ncbi:hypothetical protein ACFL23_01180 [Patescibacteria group bacterium]
MEKSEHNIEKWPVPAFLFIGIGVGILLRQVAAFVLIGLGLGILLIYLKSNQKK